VRADSDCDDAVLPGRYSLQPVGSGYRSGDGRGASAVARGSLPHVLAGPPALSRHDAHLLSQWRRQQQQQQRDDDDHRGRFAVILSVSLLTVITRHAWQSIACNPPHPAAVKHARSA